MSAAAGGARPEDGGAVPPPADAAPPIEAGRVGRPHGLDGSFIVTLPILGALTKGATVTVAGRPRKIVRRAGTDERPIVRLEQAASREDAEALRGEPLWVSRDVLPPLEEDEWWAEDLVGCAVVDSARGVDVGSVVEFRPLPSCEVLEVDRGHGGDRLLVPLVRDAVRFVDVEAKRIDVSLDFLGEA